MLERTNRDRRGLLRPGILVPVAGLVAIPLYLWVTFGFTYSLGERVGIIRKTAEIGWACRSYTGELVMGSEAGPMAKIFKFNVRDKDVAAKIDELAGERVVVHYEQHKGVPSTCFRDSEYFVTGVQRL